MFFRNHRGNRRLRPGQKLEVKLRANEARAARTRWAFRAVTVAAGTVFALYVLWRLGDWSLDKFVYENPSFAIDRVVVQTDGQLPVSELRRWSGVQTGANLIALDLASVKRNLELVSMIDMVSIERVLPRTLIIRVKERRPVAQANILRGQASGEMLVSVFQLDVSGHVMQPSGLASQPLSKLKSQFPAVVGLKPAELQPGHSLVSVEGLAALRLIAAYDNSRMPGLVDLQSVDVSEPGVLVATSIAGGQVTFATDRLDQQMQRWQQVFEWGQGTGRMIAAMDLAVSNNVPVKWNVANVIPETNQHQRPPHSRRRNV